MKRLRTVSVCLFVISLPVWVWAQNNTPVTGLTSARVKSLVGVAVAITSLILSIRARPGAGDPASQKPRQNKLRLALLLGMAGILLSLLHLFYNRGDFGTGGGRAGAIVALVIALVATLLSAISLARLKRKAA
ncbi:DUF6223 family protein [Paraflavitalea sp. CAU 1676]|uniref:DUF6223 family protein n=1 Tax=Paraflavitalea sp. CAU 1676 TaxID=3032598 RepID=UPI0023DBC290|nr:DUF6223 family protein [Paraflavitalea sp. CAU 1676]MDF2188347.1 DUF6223 family protein [Paraflavitalea sp. CAU 1676]